MHINDYAHFFFFLLPISITPQNYHWLLFAYPQKHAHNTKNIYTYTVLLFIIRKKGCTDAQDITQRSLAVLALAANKNHGALWNIKTLNLHNILTK